MHSSVQVCLDSRERVFALVTAMAGMVEGAVDQGIEALLAGDCELAQGVLQKEIVVNSMAAHIDAAVLEHIARKDVPGQDLPSMTSILKINKDLERMGDLAADIGRKVMERDESWWQCRGSELQPMAIAVSHICRKTLRALARRDLVLAQSALDNQDGVYKYRDYVSSRIPARLNGCLSDRDSDLSLLLASQRLEEIASCAVNLADHVVSWMRGKTLPELLAG